MLRCEACGQEHGLVKYYDGEHDFSVVLCGRCFDVAKRRFQRAGKPVPNVRRLSHAERC